MEMVEVFRALRRRRLLAIALVVLAVGAAVLVKAKLKSVPTGSATAQILVDSPQSALADLQQPTAPLAERASVFAQLMTSGTVLQSIAKAAGVPTGEVTAQGPYSGTGQALNVVTPSEARGVQILATKALYHLTFVAQTTIPIVTVSVTGPSAAAAGKMANSVYPGVQAWLHSLEVGNVISPGRRVTVRQLGNAQAGEVNSSSSTILAGVAAVGVMILGLLILIGIDGASRSRRHRAALHGWQLAGDPLATQAADMAHRTALPPPSDANAPRDDLSVAAAGFWAEQASAPQFGPDSTNWGPEDTVDPWPGADENGFAPSPEAFPEHDGGPYPGDVSAAGISGADPQRPSRAG